MQKLIYVCIIHSFSFSKLWTLRLGSYVWHLSCSAISSSKDNFSMYEIQQSTKPSVPLFYSLSILKLEDVIHLNILSFIYQAIDNTLGPGSFHNYFTPYCYVRRHGTRQATRGDGFISLKRASPYRLKIVQHFGSL